jgi:hypothetical protein
LGGFILLPINASSTPYPGQAQMADATVAARSALEVPYNAPSLRQTGFGVSATDNLEPAPRFSAGHPKVQIYHPSQAPSAQTTENVLMARALLMQPFAHSGAATKIARLSNMFQDAPRFGTAVNLLS